MKVNNKINDFQFLLKKGPTRIIFSVSLNPPLLHHETNPHQEIRVTTTGLY